MWIKSARFVNFGPHVDLELEFSQGLIGLFGSNGAGKSHVTDGIYAALTGDFGRFVGDKADCIRDTAEEDDPSSITVVADHGGTEFTLRRGLRPNRSELSIVGREEAFTKAIDIRREMDALLGIDGDLLDTYVFVKQWAMFEFLSQTAGKRAETYQKLCKTMQAAKVYRAIGDMLDSDEIPASVEFDGDAIRECIEREGKELKKAKKDLARAEKGLMSDERRAKAVRIIGKRKRYGEISEQLAKDVEAVKKSRPKRKTAVDDLKRQQELREGVRELVDELSPQADEARSKLRMMAQSARVAKQRTTLTERITRLEAERELNTAPEEPDSFGEIENIKERQKVAKPELFRIDQILDNMSEDGLVECPTCGTPTDDIAGHLAKMEKCRPALAMEVIDLGTKIQDCDEYIAAKEAFELDLSALAQRLETARTDLGVIVDDDALLIDADETELNSVIGDHDKQSGNLRKLDDSIIPELKKALRKIDDAIAPVVDRVGKAEKGLRDNKVEDSSVNNAKKAQVKHEAAGKEVATFTERVRNLVTSIEKDTVELERLESLATRKNKIIRLRRRLDKIRKIMHPRNLPQVVAQRNLEDMESEINKVLASFGDPFWVEASEDLSFIVHFPGSPARPAARLSGGQKGVLAVAFRSAVSSLFGAEIGMMILDEPTAGMDEENVGFLSDALSRFAAELRGRRQVIMITHADALRPAFDQVIDIGA